MKYWLKQNLITFTSSCDLNSHFLTELWDGWRGFLLALVSMFKPCYLSTTQIHWKVWILCIHRVLKQKTLLFSEKTVSPFSRGLLYLFAFCLVSRTGRSCSDFSPNSCWTWSSICQGSSQSTKELPAVCQVSSYCSFKCPGQPNSLAQKRLMEHADKVQWCRLTPGENLAVESWGYELLPPASPGPARDTGPSDTTYPRRAISHTHQLSPLRPLFLLHTGKIWKAETQLRKSVP